MSHKKTDRSLDKVLVLVADVQVSLAVEKF